MKRKLQKAISLVLAFGVVCSLFAGCSIGKTNNTDVDTHNTDGNTHNTDGNAHSDSEENEVVINLNDYVNYETSSYEGVGAVMVYNAAVSFSYYQFCQENKDKLAGFYTIKDLENIFLAPGGNEPIYVECVSDDESLENNKVLKYKWCFNEDEFDKIKALFAPNCKFEYEDFAVVCYERMRWDNRLQMKLYPAFDTDPAAVDIDGISKNGLRMEDYITINQYGRQGEGTVLVELDRTKFLQACSHFLADGHTIPDIIEALDFQPIYEREIDGFKYNFGQATDLSNGDSFVITAQMSDVNMNTGANSYDVIANMLTVPLEELKYEYTVKDLVEAKPVDVFENIFYLPSGDPVTGWKGLVVRSYIKLPTGENASLAATVTKSDKSNINVGDTLTVDFTKSAKQYTEVFGDDLFDKLSGEITVEYLPYLPVGDKAEDMFKKMDEKTMRIMKSCMNGIIKYIDGIGEYSIEPAGMMLYYMNEGNRLEAEYNNLNQLFVIFKIVDSNNPNGFYSFLGYNSDLYIGNDFNYLTGEIETCIYDVNIEYVAKDFRYYKNEHPKMFKPNGEVPATFENNGITYFGHKTLEDACAAIQKNFIEKSGLQYDNLIVSDELKDIIP